jgi:hypothetical protein
MWKLSLISSAIDRRLHGVSQPSTTVFRVDFSTSWRQLPNDDNCVPTDSCSFNLNAELMPRSMQAEIPDDHVSTRHKHAPFAGRPLKP